MRWLGTFAAALFAATAHGQVHLGEEAKVGDLARVEVSLTLQGVMKVEHDGKPEALPMGATATHAFAERVEAADARGATVRVRHYEAAKSARVRVENDSRSPESLRGFLNAARTLRRDGIALQLGRGC